MCEREGVRAYVGEKERHQAGSAASGRENGFYIVLLV